MKIETIEEVVLKDYNLLTSQIASKSRRREIVECRQVIHFFGRQMTKLSLRSIGREVGSKKYCTVIHSCNHVQNLIETDKKFREYIYELDKKLGKLALKAVVPKWDINTLEGRKQIFAI